MEWRKRRRIINARRIHISPLKKKHVYISASRISRRGEKKKESLCPRGRSSKRRTHTDTHTRVYTLAAVYRIYTEGKASKALRLYKTVVSALRKGRKESETKTTTALTPLRLIVLRSHEFQGRLCETGFKARRPLSERVAPPGEGDARGNPDAHDQLYTRRALMVVGDKRGEKRELYMLYMPQDRRGADTPQ